MKTLDQNEIKNEISEPIESNKIIPEEIMLNPLKDTFSKEEVGKLDLNANRILFECKTMHLINIQSMKKNKSNIVYNYNLSRLE